MRPHSSVKPLNNYSIEIPEKRPKSALTKYPLINKSTQQKNYEKSKILNDKIKIIPQKIEKEELYEDTVYLKIKINKLRKQLDEAKSTIVQKDLELKQKNKIIEDCSRDNDIDIVHKENLEKGKESSLVSKCKNKYFEMKKKYKKKCEENEILKAHIKITKVKSLENENINLQNEMEKLKNLYLNSQEEIESGNKEIEDLNEFKDKFIEQHNLIKLINNNCEQLNKENKELKNKLYRIDSKYSKNLKEKKKLKTINMKLKFNNEKLLVEKKQREDAMMNQKNLELKKVKLEEKLNEYKSEYNKKRGEIEKYKDIEKGKIKYNNQNDNIIKTKEEKNINSDLTESKINEHIKNLLNEAQLKVKIYEKYLNENKYNLSRILRDNNYNNGLMNSKSIPLNLKSNPKPPSPKRLKSKLSENYKYEEKEEIESYIPIEKRNNNNDDIIEERKEEDYDDLNNEKKSEEDYEKHIIVDDDKIIEEEEKKSESENKEDKKSESENKEEKEENKEENEVNNNYLEEEKSEKILEEKKEEEELNESLPENINEIISSLPHIIVKNLEANNITTKYLEEEFKKIFEKFDSNDEVSKNDFLEPFSQLIIENMKIKNKKDIKIINLYLDNLLEEYENDTEKFIDNLSQIFNSLNNYDNIDENEMDEKLIIELKKYPNLIKSLKEKDIKKNNIISYMDFKVIHSDLNLQLDDDLIEYLLYKMKKSVDSNQSMLDLNYKIIEDLIGNENKKKNKIKENILKEEIKSESEKENNKSSEKQNDEDDHFIIENDNRINIIFNQLKNKLNDKNSNLDDVLTSKTQYIEIDNEQKEGIPKEDFIEILKQNEIELEQNDINDIYDKFKFDDKYDDAQNLLNISLIKEEYERE